jgi:hypothetical protein
MEYKCSAAITVCGLRWSLLLLTRCDCYTTVSGIAGARGIAAAAPGSKMGGKVDENMNILNEKVLRSTDFK